MERLQKMSRHHITHRYNELLFVWINLVWFDSDQCLAVLLVQLRPLDRKPKQLIMMAFINWQGNKISCLICEVIEFAFPKCVLSMDSCAIIFYHWPMYFKTLWSRSHWDRGNNAPLTWEPFHIRWVELPAGSLRWETRLENPVLMSKQDTQPLD